MSISITEIHMLRTIQKRYDELLQAVETKYPGQTRHETALNYIKQAEMGNAVAMGAVRKEYHGN
jgi:hypothetical protein